MISYKVNRAEGILAIRSNHVLSTLQVLAIVFEVAELFFICDALIDKNERRTSTESGIEHTREATKQRHQYYLEQQCAGRQLCLLPG